MRISLFVVLVLFHCFLLTVHAEEIIVAHVVSLDRENEQIIVEIASGLEGRGKETLSLKTGSQTDSSKTPSLITVSTANSNFPCWLEPGSLVRIWGDFDRTAGKIAAKSLHRARFRGGAPDDTGVRKRLKRCGKHRQGRSKHHGGH